MAFFSVHSVFKFFQHDLPGRHYQSIKVDRWDVTVKHANPKSSGLTNTIIFSHDSVGQQLGLNSTGQFFCWLCLAPCGFMRTGRSKMASLTGLVVGISCRLDHISPAGWPRLPHVVCLFLCASQASAKVPLSKANHVTKPKVNMEGASQGCRFTEAWFTEGHFCNNILQVWWHFIDQKLIECLLWARYCAWHWV